MVELEEIIGFVGSTDLDRSAAFYGGVLGLRLRDERPDALSALHHGRT